MTRIARTLALLALAMTSTAAFADPIRTLEGDRVETEDFVVVPFTMDDHQSVQVLRELSGHRGVLAVNLDGASEQSQLKSFLHSQGIEIAVVCDPEGRLRSGPPARLDEVEGLMLAAQALAAGDQVVAVASE
jgi:hypothetical protein